MVECEKMQDFLQANFPLLNKKSQWLTEKRRAQQSDENQIDISIYFDEKDKFLVTETDKNLVAFSEFALLSKQDLKPDHFKKRVDVLEKYNEILNDFVKQAAAKNYDKFRNLFC